MGKQDYREAIEKGRQEIFVHNNSAPSRRAHRKMGKEKPRKNRSILLPTLFFLFILIPVSLLIYVAFFYEPNDTLSVSSVNNEVSLETLSPEPPLVPVALDEEEPSVEQQADEDEVEKAAAEKEAELQEQATAKEKEAEVQAQREREQAEAKRQQEQAEAKLQQEQAEAKRQQEAAEQKKQEEKQNAHKTHTVQPGETLYRIAVNTYGASGASAGVEKIKQANGLSSNEISVGATLVLP